MDLHADLTQPVTLFAGKALMIPTGISIALPATLEAQVRSRSGLAAKNQVVVLNSPGTIDSDYRGQIKVILYNHHAWDNFEIKPGDRIAQMVIAPVVQVAWSEVEELNDTARGTGGFGSTGV
jgi:dUTP pyrophosphatase